MTNEKILKDEILKDEKLDSVSGGTGKYNSQAVVDPNLVIVGKKVTGNESLKFVWIKH